MRIFAIVPALNEEATVVGVIHDVLAACPAADVLVVDDGSADRTSQVARAAGARVVRLPFAKSSVSSRGSKQRMIVSTSGPKSLGSALRALSPAGVMSIGMRTSPAAQVDRSVSIVTVMSASAASTLLVLSGVNCDRFPNTWALLAAHPTSTKPG